MSGGNRRYSSLGKSSHGLFTIEDEDDDEDVEISFNEGNESSTRSDVKSVLPKLGNDSIFSPFYFIWNTITFAWMKPLLSLGNTRALEQADLYPLPATDTSEGIYSRFRKYWSRELRRGSATGSDKPDASLVNAFMNAFGLPFFAAGGLKLIHDSCLFVGPMMLSALIGLLSDSSRPATVGYYYVLGLFLSNFMMSLCLRQYFWWCFRVGMNLRSAVVTAVYNKSLSISAATLSSKSTGEITNLMSVDATRLQDLTPYLHAIWYSFYQIVIALVLLWRQVGPASLAGIAVIVATIPLTGKISGYLKTLQKSMSSVRDERIKISNEVLAGMKVIKLQAWESEYQNKINAVRAKELDLFKKYCIAQSLSGAVYTTIPLLVGIFTFIAYIALGNTLDVATALTSLALFEILRFPLFMLPNVLNNIVEAKVSVDRVQNYLLESEKEAVPMEPLQVVGVLLSKATLIWERNVGKKIASDAKDKKGLLSRIFSYLIWIKDSVIWALCKLLGRAPPAAPAATTGANRYSKDKTGLQPFRPGAASYSCADVEHMTKEEYHEAISQAQLWEAENRIDELESMLGLQVIESDLVSDGVNQSDFDDMANSGPISPLHSRGSIEMTPLNSAKPEESTSTGERLLTLSRINFRAEPGQLIAIVGQVGAGKSSILGAILGDMKLCFGGLARRGRVAYVGQKPFIQNSTLQDNITFGQSHDEERYQETLRQCALLPDLKVLPAGDMTEIGERGINLSGGQKARVALARAVYYNADVFLLDDPLAAVDAHVGQHLFQQCILPLQRKNKCVLLVTNALQFAKHCSKILVIRNGRIVESGSFDALCSNKLHFADMMSAFQDTKDEVNSSSASSKSASAGFDESDGHESKEKHAEASESTKSSLPASPTAESKAAEVKCAPAKAAAPSGSLMTIEDREVGNVSMEVYRTWAAAAGGVNSGIFMILLYCAGEGVAVLASWWLSFWSQHRNTGSPWFYLGIYIAINFGLASFMLARELYGRMIALDAARELFKGLLAAVLYAPMEFFDTTPLGRIINRFSKDIYTIDEQIPQTARWYMASMCKVFGVLLYISVITPLFVLCLIPICGVYVVSQRYYIKTSRELTRLDSMSRSPIFALFSETLDGLSTIRAFQSETRFLTRNNNLLDANQQAYFLNFSANCWLAVRLELAGTMIVTLAALLAVLGKQFQDTSSPDFEKNQAVFAGMAGLSVSMALSVTQSLNWSVRMASDLESQMVSVERVKNYSSMPQEADHYTPGDPAPSWPSKGAIEMRDVHMRYRAGLPLVLRGVTLSIAAGEKVGIVGRTGAGKSSLLAVFLRLVELESGTVIVDGVDVKTVGLNCLRSRIAVIPQDPVLFSGSIRSNLDPFMKHSDLELWESLRRTTLSSVVGSLEDTVAENGSNFSVGQRQLLCIARALLSRAKIIIMDEATAAVDVETDAAIQKSIKEEFACATCLTVAHRLNTIMDSSKVLVMDQGQVAEFDTPANLLDPNRSSQSMFAGLVAHWDEDQH